MADIDGHKCLQKYTAPSLYKVQSLPVLYRSLPGLTQLLSVVSGSVVPVIYLLYLLQVLLITYPLT